MWIITGLGRSGTSFIAEIFHNLGYEMDEYNPDVDAGYEHPDISGVNKTIINGDYWHTEEQIKFMKYLAQKHIVVKDPRFMITLPIWLKSEIQIDGIFFCKRSYFEIIRSSEDTNAGLMAMFNGWPVHIRIEIMHYLEHGIIDICLQSNIRFHPIWFPDSLSDFNEVLSLDNVINNKDKLYKVWKETIREVKR